MIDEANRLLLEAKEIEIRSQYLLRKAELELEQARALNRTAWERAQMLRIRSEELRAKAKEGTS